VLVTSTLDGSITSATATQQRPNALATLSPWASPCPPLPSGACRRSPVTATQTEDGSMAGASIATMASSRTGGHVLVMRGVGLSSDVRHLGGGPWRRISFPAILPVAAPVQPCSGARWSRVLC
jgi:hypothetical protein